MTTRCWACEATHGAGAAFCSTCGAAVAPSAESPERATPTFDPTPEALLADVSTTGTIDTRPRANRLLVVVAVALVGLVIYFVASGGDDAGENEAASPDDRASSSTSAPADSVAAPLDSAAGARSGTEDPAVPSTGAPVLLGQEEMPERFESFREGEGTTLVAHTEEAIVIVDLGSGAVTVVQLADTGSNFNGTPTVVGVGVDVVVARGRTAIRVSTSDGEVVDLGQANV
ncbi:MAG: hypothetical protein HKN26_00025, partial [Acidimicrobiales bacterium]|nr:hypothetical protein [Acidimicrobiales bacterium]